MHPAGPKLVVLKAECALNHAGTGCIAGTAWHGYQPRPGPCQYRIWNLDAVISLKGYQQVNLFNREVRQSAHAL